MVLSGHSCTSSPYGRFFELTNSLAAQVLGELPRGALRARLFGIEVPVPPAYLDLFHRAGRRERVTPPRRPKSVGEPPRTSTNETDTETRSRSFRTSDFDANADTCQLVRTDPTIFVGGTVTSRCLRSAAGADQGAIAVPTAVTQMRAGEDAVPGRSRSENDLTVISRTHRRPTDDAPLCRRRTWTRTPSTRSITAR